MAAVANEREPDDGAPCLTGRKRWDAALIAALVAFAWFAFRAARGLPFEDAGLLASAAWAFGVPHPPGYPLWTLLGGTWARLAAVVGLDVVLSLSLFSAAAAAGTAGVLAALVRSRGASLALAVVAAVAPLLAAPTFAAQAVTIEIYALAGFLQAVALALAFAPVPRPRATAFALGLGLAAHPNTLFVAPALLAVALVRARVRSVRGVAAAVAWLLAPLLLYAYVPLAAARDPAVNWGEATGGAALVDHLLRSQYATGLERDWSALLGFLFRDGMQAYTVVALAALVFMLPRFARRRRRDVLAALAVVVAAFTSAAAAIAWPMSDENRARLAGSLVPLIVATAAFGGLGAAAITHLRYRFVGRRALEGVLIAFFVFLVAKPLAWDAPSALNSETFLRHRAGAEPYARTLLESLPPDAVLVVNRVGHTDILGFPLLFAQVVRGVRPDVTLVDRGMLAAAWYRRQLARRSPDLAPALAAFDALFAERPDLLADPRSRRLAAAPFLGALFAGPRPLAFTDAPGPAVLQGRALVAGPLHLEWVPDGRDAPRAHELAAAPPAPAEAERPDAGVWSALFAELAAERASLRAGD